MFFCEVKPFVNISSMDHLIRITLVFQPHWQTWLYVSELNVGDCTID